MSHWTINTQYVTPKVFNKTPYGKSGSIGEIVIGSSMKSLGIKESDLIIFIDPIDNTLKFSSHGFVEKVLEPKVIKPSSSEIHKRQSMGLSLPEDTYQHYYNFYIQESVQENNLLSDMEYSIKDVYRFNKPQIHFQQQFRALKEEDFETIVHGWIYKARTTFGKIINALPRVNKLEFMLEAMDEFSTIDFRDVPLIEGLEFLNDYLQRRILSTGRLLVEIDKILNNDFKDILPVEQIGFICPESVKGNLISEQSNYFKKILPISDSGWLTNEIIQPDLDDRFQKIFAKETWPIDLTL